jgi:hypothetical protein
MRHGLRVLDRVVGMKFAALIFAMTLIWDVSILAMKME